MRRCILKFMAVLHCLILAPVAAAGYPDQPLRAVVAFSPGGTTDIVARELGLEMTKRLGVSVVIENKAGAGGNIGSETVINSRPDGYTLLVSGIGPITVNPSLYKGLRFDPLKDLMPVSPIATVPLVLVVNVEQGHDSVDDLLASLRKKGDNVNFASTGVGTIPHLTGEIFAMKTDLPAVHIPYKGAEAVNDLMAGRVDFMFATLPSVLSHIHAGKLKALATPSSQRVKALPDVPTLAEAGVPDLITGVWFGLFAPAQTDAEAVETINSAVMETLGKDHFVERLQTLGAEPMPLSRDEFEALIKDSHLTWKTVIDSLGQPL